MLPGDLRHRLTFQRRALDENEDRVGEFEDVFTVWASIDYQRGSELAVGNRLEGLQPATIVIRDTKATRAITTAFRAVRRVDPTIRDAEDEIFNITAVAEGRERGFLNLMGYSGGETG